MEIHYIGAKWCSTCKTIKPATEELAKRFSVALTCFDLDEDLDEKEKDMIRKIPTLRIFKNGINVEEFTINQIKSLEAYLQANVVLSTEDF